MTRLSSLLSLSLVGAAMGCSANRDLTGPLAYCTATASISVEVTVMDSVTGNSIADAARGVIQSASTSDSLRYFPSPPMLAGGNTLGTFSVIVDHAGYSEWRRDNVVVSQKSECGSVIPVPLTAKMVPLP